MQLEKFTNLLAGTSASGPPYRIPAAILDNNFARLQPLQGDGVKNYSITETPNGWSLELFPERPPTGTYVLGCINGQITWLTTEACS